jgi:hypothetical protein
MDKLLSPNLQKIKRRMMMRKSQTAKAKKKWKTKIKFSTKIQ